MKRLALQFSHEDTVAHVVLNRPDKHNGVDWLMLKEMRQIQKKLQGMKRLRAVIIRGEGSSFCAGLDFKSVLSDPKTAAVMYAHLWMPFRNIFQTWSTGWRQLAVPVIAQIHGNCFGAGIQLALGADIRVCHSDAKLSILEAKWGLVPDMGGAALLHELVPVDVAKELTMTGRILPAADAGQLGLVSHVCDNPESKTDALLQEILQRSPDSVAASKFMIQRIWGLDESVNLTQERRWQRRLLGFKNQRVSVMRNSKAENKDIAFARRQIH